MKNYKETKCLICDVIFKARGSRHYYCDKCIKDKEKARNQSNIDNTGIQKVTWRNLSTISRSQLMRRKKKLC